MTTARTMTVRVWPCRHRKRSQISPSLARPDIPVAPLAPDIPTPARPGRYRLASGPEDGRLNSRPAADAAERRKLCIRFARQHLGDDALLLRFLLARTFSSQGIQAGAGTSAGAFLMGSSGGTALAASRSYAESRSIA